MKLIEKKRSGNDYESSNTSMAAYESGGDGRAPRPIPSHLKRKFFQKNHKPANIVVNNVINNSMVITDEKMGFVVSNLKTKKKYKQVRKKKKSSRAKNTKKMKFMKFKEKVYPKNINEPDLMAQAQRDIISRKLSKKRKMSCKSGISRVQKCLQKARNVEENEHEKKKRRSKSNKRSSKIFRKVKKRGRHSIIGSSSRATNERLSENVSVIEIGKYFDKKGRLINPN